MEKVIEKFFITSMLMCAVRFLLHFCMPSTLIYFPVDNDKSYREVLITSMLMWAVPIANLYAFKNNLFLGYADQSPYSLTLLSGFLAVSVNIVIAMRDPSEMHEPDPKFVTEAAEASVKHVVVPNQAHEGSSTRKKDE